jgi:transposase-like protein
LLEWKKKSRRTTNDYKLVFKFFKKKIGKFAVKEIVSDFEKGIWNGMRLVFKKVSFHGCTFHWTQAIFRRLKFEGLSKFFFPKQIYNKCVAKW